jgi:hypothetical protein
VQGKIALNSKTEIRQAFRSLFSTPEGRRRSNKYYENGSFATAETMFCKYSVKLPLDIVLNDLEARLTPGERLLLTQGPKPIKSRVLPLLAASATRRLAWRS